MKLTNSEFLFWLGVAASTCFATTMGHGGMDHSKNQMGCVDPTTHDPNTNFFPQQAVPVASKNWDVRYESSYKVVKNIQESVTYILYQCGTVPPTIEDEPAVDGASAIISVPIAGAGLSSTTDISKMEILNLRSKIGVYYGDASMISSPCLLEMMKGDSDGTPPMTASIQDMSNETAKMEILTEAQRELTIFTGGTFNTPDNSVAVSEWSESTSAGTFEWIKYMALFFNEEGKANEVYDEVIDRYNCIEDSVQLPAESDGAKPTVLWANYNGYCEGWDVASCPNYYCEFAESCSSDMLHSPPNASVTEGPCAAWGAKLTTEEIVAFGKDADHWIYPSTDWDTVYAENKDLLDQMKSVQKKQVFDYQGSGNNAWFEQRMVEYENVLEDFCAVVGTIQIRDRVWFRNVFDEAIGNLGSCPDPTAPYEPSVTECVRLSDGMNNDSFAGMETGAKDVTSVSNKVEDDHDEEGSHDHGAHDDHDSNNDTDEKGSHDHDSHDHNDSSAMTTSRYILSSAALFMVSSLFLKQ